MIRVSRAAGVVTVLALSGASAAWVVACAPQEGVVADQPHTTGAGKTKGPKGASASDFTARDIDGNTIKLSDHLGKDVILLDFCATWCEPCIAEFPHLRRMVDANKAKGFYVLAIAMDGPETLSNVPSFAKRNQLNFPMVTDDDSRIASLYNPKKSAPFSVLIDRSGKIVATREGYNPGDEEFVAKDVQGALDSTGSSAPPPAK